MEKSSVYSYYMFGYNYNVLRTLEITDSKSEAISLLRRHIEILKKQNLAVTLNIIRYSSESIISELEAEQGDSLTYESLKKIKDLLDKADACLDSELTLKKVLSVTPKRFETESLLNRPKNLLATNVWEKLSEQAQIDFSESTKCIAMNLPTASAFHMMRSVEQCLKDLYFHFVKRNRLNKPMWGPMVTKLKEKNNPKPKKETLDTLDIIRMNYRNPTQHPEKNYTIDEAQDLLNHSIAVINSIHRDMEDINI